MNQLGGTGDRPQTPWWYRVPTIAVGLIAYAVVGLVIYTAVSQSALAWAGGGLLAALLASGIQGAAQRAHDERSQ
ncbi:hypothetical protein [Streptomyces sp. NPDC001948]